MLTSQTTEFNLAVLSNRAGSETARQLSLSLASKFNELYKNSSATAELSRLKAHWQTSPPLSYDFYNSDESVKLALRCLDEAPNRFNFTPNMPVILVINTKNEYEYVFTIVQFIVYRWQHFLSEKPRGDIIVINTMNLKEPSKYAFLGKLNGHQFAYNHVNIRCYFGSLDSVVEKNILNLGQAPESPLDYFYRQNSISVLDARSKSAFHFFCGGLEVEPDGLGLTAQPVHIVPTPTQKYDPMFGLSAISDDDL